MTYLLFVHLFHLLIVGSLFLYIGIVNTSMPPVMYNVVIGFSVVIFIYHLYRAIKYWINKKEISVVNVFHVLVVSPLLMYIGLNKKQTQPGAFQVVLLLGISAMLYHGYKSLEDLHIV